MKIVVAYKWAGDPQDATVRQDGTVDFGRARPVVSEYDAVAIQVGRDLADATGGELVGVTVGGPQVASPMATKAALARGLDRVVVLGDLSADGAGTTATAQLLAALVRAVGDVRLVLTGDCSTDVGARMVPAVLGGVLGWPTVTDAVLLRPDGADLVVGRSLAEGEQSLRIALPAVVAVASDAAKPKAPSMKDVMAAGKKPVQLIAPAQTGVTPASDGVTVGTARTAGPARRGTVIDVSDPDAAAAELVGALLAGRLVSAAGARP